MMLHAVLTLVFNGAAVNGQAVYAQFTNLKTQNISGKVKVQGKTLVFKDFSYDGSTPDVYIYVGFDGCPMVSGGTPLAKLQQRKHEKEYFGLSLSTVQMQVTWVSVWDVKKDEELANAFFCPEDGDKCRGTSSVPQLSANSLSQSSRTQTRPSSTPAPLAGARPSSPIRTSTVPQLSANRLRQSSRTQTRPISPPAPLAGARPSSPIRASTVPQLSTSTSPGSQSLRTQSRPSSMPARLARPRPSSPIHLQLNGTTSSTKHGVAGTVRVEGNKIVIENFSIGKNAPAAYFYYGTDGCPSNPRNQLEFQEENERERQTILSKEGEIDITVHLNLPVDATQVKWVSVWCDKFNVDFGHAFLNNIQHQDCN